MPIYEYQCNACGHTFEELQKVSAPPLTVCPECGLSEVTKLVSAAGFHLKGTGWYATDFKDQPPASSTQAKEPKAKVTTDKTTNETKSTLKDDK